MTGTAETEASELQDIYGLEVVVVPPNTKSTINNLQGGGECLLLY